MEREDHIRELIDQMKPDRKSNALRMIDYILADPEMTYEKALEEILSEQGMTLPAEQFAIELNALYPVQFFVRNYDRRKAVQTLLNAHIPVKTIGDGWDKVHFENEQYLEKKKGIHIAVSYEAIAKEWVLFNCTPFFNHGIHDRILAGMANHTAVLTDKSRYMQTHLEQKGCVKTYSLQDMDTLVEGVKELLGNRKLWTEQTACAYDCFCREHTWKHRVLELLSYIE